ncbi:hypothetical protein K525DRAFT_275291 [Schizophyllum commune Loenen D]|nr:hypothetical protein K525DRAFT_275291 [Schizophyllum commune Loenen D]
MSSSSLFEVVGVVELTSLVSPAPLRPSPTRTAARASRSRLALRGCCPAKARGGHRVKVIEVVKVGHRLLALQGRSSSFARSLVEVFARPHAHLARTPESRSSKLSGSSRALRSPKSRSPRSPARTLSPVLRGRPHMSRGRSLLVEGGLCSSRASRPSGSARSLVEVVGVVGVV